MKRISAEAIELLKELQIVDSWTTPRKRDLWIKLERAGLVEDVRLGFGAIWTYRITPKGRDHLTSLQTTTGGMCGLK